MRIVARYLSRSEAEERAAFLRAHGIAARVTDASSMVRAAAARRDSFRALLWVILDFQYDDAVALLEDPDHPVGEALDPQALERFETEGAAHAQRLLFLGMLLLAGGLGVLFALLAFFGVI